MKGATTVSQGIVRLFGVIQIVTGLLFWTGNALALVPLHMLSGLLVVIGLWVLAGIGARAAVGPARIVVAVLWGLFVLVFGLVQASILPGDLHWIIQVLHLLVGLAALGQAESIAARIKAYLAGGATRAAVAV
jgi:hypothetical protein